MTNLQQTALEIKGKQCQIKVAAFVCNAPVCAYVKQVKQHCGYSVCGKCTRSGVHDGRMTVPDTDAPLHTDASFDARLDEDRHVGQNPLQPLGISMVSSCPLDYMHLVCLGGS